MSDHLSQSSWQSQLSDTGFQLEAIHQRRLNEERSFLDDNLLTPEFLFLDARRSAGDVKQQLDRRLASRQSELNCGDMGEGAEADGKFKELKYYNLLADLYEKNVKLMNQVVAYLNDEIANGRKQQAELDRLYGPLIRWMNNMEKELRRTLGLPSSEIGDLFEAMQIRVKSFCAMVSGSIANNPVKYAGAVGAVAGGLVLHKYFSGMCLASKILAKLGFMKCGCEVLGWGAALGVGVLCGVFLAVVGTCVYNACRPADVERDATLRPEPAFQFHDVNAAVENMQRAVQNLGNEALETELLKIAGYWDQFNDFDPQIDTSPCPVCLNTLSQDNVPVRFRGCLGRHFHCHACREACVRSNSANLHVCTVCRNAPY